MALQTREQSTLVIATVLASASLLLLTVPIDKEENAESKLSKIAPIGLFFGLIGLFYRQVTVWTIERMSYNREVDSERFSLPLWIRQRREGTQRGGETRFWRNQWSVYYLYAYIREFLLIWFLSIPVVLWGQIVYCNLVNVRNYSCTILTIDIASLVACSAAIGLWLANIDLALRVHDWKNHH